MSAPAAARFISSHEYVIPAEGEATVGVSKYAIEQLGDVVYVELPAVGTQLKKGKSFGVVESVKAVSDLYAPVDGEVVAVNQALVDDPGSLGDDPYGKGWMLRIKPADAAQLAGSDLMDPTKYDEFVASH